MRVRSLLILGCVLAILNAGRAAADELVPVRITTDPPGARVFIDGVPRSETPSVLHVPVGRHEVFVLKDGLWPVKTTVQWASGDRPILKISLRKQHGGLVVVSDPPGSDVLLDGRRLGNTPLAYEGLPGGTHRLTLRKEGFHPYETSLTLDENDAHVVDVRLDGPPVYLWVEARKNARVYIDGSYAGEITGETLGLKVRPGRHEVRIEHNGFASVQQIELKPGRDAMIAEGPMRRIPGYVAPTTARLDPRWFGVVAGSATALAGVTLAGVSAYQAHTARTDYDASWQRAGLADARERIEAANTRVWIGTAGAAVGALATWLFWPTEESAPAVAVTPDSVTLSFRFDP